jgi:hypothetical protein
VILAFKYMLLNEKPWKLRKKKKQKLVHLVSLQDDLRTWKVD